MYFPEQPCNSIAGALADLRHYLAQSPTKDAAHGPAVAALERLEQSVLPELALYDAIVNSSGDSVFVVEAAGDDLRWVLANGGFTRLTGLDADAVVGQPLIATPGCAAIYSRCKEVLDAGVPVKFDEKRDIEGRKVEIQTRLTPVRNQNGGCIRIVGVSRDVSEQRTAERLLRKQNRRLQNILDSISDGFVTVDRDWRVTFLNSRAEHILESSRATLVGASFWDSLPNLALDTLRASIEAGASKSSAMPAETIISSNDRWLAIRTFPSQEGIAIYIQDISDRKHAEHALKQGLERTQASLDGIVSAMAFAVEMRDPYTGGHQRRVSALACAIARQMGIPTEQIETLRIAGLLHDIGKISIPTEILNRPGKLSAPETIIVRTHAQISYEILKEIEFASPVALIALQHHERLDGSGYPQGLQADTIIQEARILAVADVVEAMASHRPYRPALGVECALHEVMTHSGVRYDDKAVDACLTVFKENGFDFDQLMQTEMGQASSGARNIASARAGS